MLGDLVGVANLIRDLVKDKSSENRRLVQILSKIYFSPDGVVQILESLIEGKDFDEDKAKQALLDFNDYEGHLLRDIEELSHAVTIKNKSLTMRQRRLLQNIGWQKVSVRSEVQKLLNYDFANRRPVSRRRAEELLNKIVLLNRTIEDAEEGIRG